MGILPPNSYHCPSPLHTYAQEAIVDCSPELGNVCTCGSELLSRSGRLWKAGRLCVSDGHSRRFHQWCVLPPFLSTTVTSHNDGICRSDSTHVTMGDEEARPSAVESAQCQLIHLVTNDEANYSLFQDVEMCIKFLQKSETEYVSFVSRGYSKLTSLFLGGTSLADWCESLKDSLYSLSSTVCSLPF